MDQYPWQSQYAVAMLEAVPKERLITAAEKAINDRLYASLRGTPMSLQELQAAKYALDCLSTLRRELQSLRLSS